MFLNGVKLEPKKENNLLIDLYDEYPDMDFYLNKTSEYNYITRKYAKNYMKSGRYIGLYTESEMDKLGYFYISCRMSVKPMYKYDSYVRYAELLEFGFMNNNFSQIKFLVEYMIEYAAKSGSYFIRVKTKEKSFEKFYDLLREYPHTEDENYLYLELDVVDYEFARYLKSYDGDKISIRELYQLNSIGFKVYQDKCIYELYNKDRFIIDRKTREVIYPERIINVGGKYKSLNNESLSLMHMIIFKYLNFKDEVIDVDYHIDGIDHTFIKIDHDLYTFDRFMYNNDCVDKKVLIEFSKIAYDKYGFHTLYLSDYTRFKFRIYYAYIGVQSFFLPNYFEEKEV